MSLQTVLSAPRQGECSLLSTVLFGRSAGKGTEPQRGKMATWLGQK